MLVEELVNFFDVNYANSGVPNPNNTVVPTALLPLRTGNGLSKNLASDLENKVKTTQVAMSFMGQEDVVREVFCSRALPEPQRLQAKGIVLVAYKHSVGA